MSMSKGPLEKRERLRRLCRRIVAGDGGTRAELQSATMKYVHTQYDDPTQVLKRLYRDEGELGSLLRRAVEVCEGAHKQLDDQEYSPATGAQYPRTRRFLDVSDDDDGDALDRDRDLLGDDDNDDNDDGDDDMEKRVDHHVSRLADLLVESGRFTDRGHALRHLTSHPDGVALMRTHKAKDDPPMDTVHSIMKAGSISGVCAAIVAKGTATISEREIVDAVSKIASERWPQLTEAQGFSKILEAPTEEARVLQHALKIAKAAEFSVFDIKPVVVGSPDAMHAAVDDTEQSAALRAYEEILRIGREKFPFLPADQQFARVFEDSKYAVLAAQAHSRPAPTTIYRPPASQGTAYTKSDPVPNTDTAYGELMAKAEEYRSAHPELSIAQAFEKVYAAPANRELAKRERMESAPR
jgi:hypothetical protein